MNKFYLNVPFDEKDLAKAKGAFWDPQKKKWYVPAGKNSLTFIKWIHELTSINHYDLYCENYFIAQAMRHCWKCAASLPVYTFCLPAGYKALEIFEVDSPSEWLSSPSNEWCESGLQDELIMEHFDHETAHARRWYSASQFSFVSNIETINSSALRLLQNLSQSYKKGYSRTLNQSYYANHCPHCGRLQGDFMLHCEPGAAFFPVSIEHARQIKLYPIKQPIFLSGNTSISSEDFFQWMTTENTVLNE